MRGRVDGETQFRFLPVINRKAFQKQRSETGAGTAADGVENKKPLKASAVIGKLSDAVKAQIYNFFPDCQTNRRMMLNREFHNWRFQETFQNQGEKGA